MKRDPDFNVETILAEMRKSLSNENLPDRVGGGGSPEARLEAGQRLAEYAKNPGKHILTICIACMQEASILDVTPCECGGFVCNACAAQEDDGVCDHELPEFMKELRDAD